MKKYKVIGLVVLFVISLGGAYLFGQKKKEGNSKLELYTNTSSVSAAMLPDSTWLDMNCYTRIRYTEVAGNMRELEGDGEYCLSVPPSAKPMVIKNGPMGEVFVAPGTIVNIQSYEHDNCWRVSKLTGEVHLAVNDSILDLADNTEARFDGYDHVHTGVQVVQTSTEVRGWTKQNTVFSDCPMSVILHSIGRCFEVDFDLTETSVILGQRGSASWSWHETPEAILERLQSAGYLTFKRVDTRKYVLYPIGKK